MSSELSQIPFTADVFVNRWSPIKTAQTICVPRCHKRPSLCFWWCFQGKWSRENVSVSAANWNFQNFKTYSIKLSKLPKKFKFYWHRWVLKSKWKALLLQPTQFHLSLSTLSASFSSFMSRGGFCTRGIAKFMDFMNIQVISSSRMHFNASNALQHNKLRDCRGFSTWTLVKWCHQSGVKKLNETARVHWAFVSFLCVEPFLLFICFPISPKKYINCPLVNDLTHCGYLFFFSFSEKCMNIHRNSPTQLRP